MARSLLSNYQDLEKIEELSISDLIDLQKGMMLEIDNNDAEDEEDVKFMKDVNESRNKLSELSLEDDLEAPLKTGLPPANFDEVRGKMEDISGDGKVLKLVKKKGFGGVIPNSSQVTLKYLAFVEFQDEPFDSTFAHEYTTTVRLDSNVIPGLSLGVSTMEKHETSMFLIHPELAYGAIGIPPRVPPNTEVLFVVSVVGFVDNALADTYNELDREQKRCFTIVVPRAKNVMNSAKDCFERKKYKQAIREYSKAVKWLETMKLEDGEEEREMKKLLSKAYTNLAVCYNLEGKPRGACTACINIPIPSTKSIFQHGRALARLGEYKEAMVKLQEALKKEPRNKEIIDEVGKVNELLTKYKSLSKNLWSNCLKVTKEEKGKSGFEKSVEDMCKTFIKDSKLLRQHLPEGLSADEEKCLRATAVEYGLYVSSHIRHGKQELYLNKNAE